MREVVGPQQAIDVAEISYFEGYPVVLKGQINVLAEIFARHPAELGSIQGVALDFVGVIHSVHKMRRPSRVSLGAHEFEFGVTLEDAAEDHGRQDVLHAADYRHESRDFRAARSTCEGTAGG